MTGKTRVARLFRFLFFFVMMSFYCPLLFYFGLFLFYRRFHFGFLGLDFSRRLRGNCYYTDKADEQACNQNSAERFHNILQIDKAAITRDFQILRGMRYPPEFRGFDAIIEILVLIVNSFSRLIYFAFITCRSRDSVRLEVHSYRKTVQRFGRT